MRPDTIIIVVLAAAAVLACAADAAAVPRRHRWVTVTAATGELNEQVLAGRYDVRGVYGMRPHIRTALFSSHDSDDMKNAFAALAKPRVTLHGDVADDHERARVWAIELPEVLNAKDQTTVNQLLSQFEAIASDHDAGVFFVRIPIDKIIEWPESVQAIRVPRRGIRPTPASLKDSPAYEYLKTLSKNSIIENAVAKVNKDELYATVLNLSENFYTRQSASTGAQQAVDYLVGRFTSFGITLVTTQSYRSDYAPNIIAEIRGRVEPNKYVIVGAHFDSRNANSNDPTGRAPGADDNGSGTSAIVELARVISSLNNTFVYSIRFCLWTGEEQGLLGSDAYATMISDRGDDVVAYFNADMLGYRIPGMPIEMGMKDRSITQWLLEVSYAIDALYVPELPVKLSSSCCSDYISFYDVGYPSIGFFENPTTASTYPQYHTSNDVISNLDFDQIKVEASAILANLMTFAVPN